MVGAEVAAVLQLGLAARGGDHRGAARLRVLDRERPDPAGAAVHQERLARGEVRVRQGRPDRRRDLEHPGRVDEVVAGRRREHLAGGYADALGVPAAGEQGDARLADLEPADAGPEGGHVPRDLEPDGLAGPRRRRVVALPLHEVGPVDPGPDDVDQHLARAGLGVRHLTDLQDVGISRLGHDDGTHPASLPLGSDPGRGRIVD